MCLCTPQTHLQAKLFSPRCIINVTGSRASKVDSKSAVWVLSVKTGFCTNTAHLLPSRPSCCHAPMSSCAAAHGAAGATAKATSRDTARGGTAQSTRLHREHLYKRTTSHSNPSFPWHCHKKDSAEQAMRFSTFAPLPTVKVTRLHSRSLGIPDREGGAAVPFLETLWGLSYLWPAPMPPNIMQEICMCFCTQLLYPSPLLALHGDLGRRGRQLCVDTLCKTKKTKSCIVPEIHELFKHSQVCCLNHCTNFHLLTYTKNRDEQWLRRRSARKAPAPPWPPGRCSGPAPSPERHKLLYKTSTATAPTLPSSLLPNNILPLACS